MAAQFSQTTRSLAADRPVIAHIAWGTAIALLAAWMTWFFLGSVTVYELSKHARLEVRQAPHHVAALVASKVVSTSLQIGQEVRVGDVLVSLDTSSETLRLKEEEARLEAMPQRIASLRKEIEARERAKAGDMVSAAAAADAIRSRGREAGLAVDFAKDHEQRIKQLSAGGWASTVETMRAMTDSRKLAATRDALLADLRKAELDAKTRAHEYEAQIENLRQSVATIEGEMSITRAIIERLKADIEKHLVRAPISGRIGDVVPLHAGAYVSEGQRLSTIVPAGDLMIVAEFTPSFTLGRVRPGQPGRLRLDGFPWAQFGTISATVSRVASEIRDNTVRVELTLDPDASSSPLVQHGLPGSVEVSVERESPATLLMRAAGFLLAGPAKQSLNTAQLAR